MANDQRVGTAGQAEGTVARQKQERVDPGPPLDRQDGGVGIKALFVPQPKGSFHCTVTDLDLPALPSPE